MSTEVIELPTRLPQAVTPVAPMAMLSLAVSQGASIEVLEKLMALAERYEANEAWKAFNQSVAAAKAEFPVVKKNRHVGFASKSGGAKTDYWHEDLAEIARTIDPILGKHGLGYRFRTKAAPNEPITVTCILFHKNGHSEENTLCAGRDETGNKNSIQSIGSTQTYLSRYTLKAALGLAAAKDDDGRTSEAPNTITDEQVQALSLAITETKSDIAKFLRFFKVEALSELPAEKFEQASNLLNTKRKPE